MHVIGFRRIGHIKFNVTDFLHISSTFVQAENEAAKTQQKSDSKKMSSLQVELLCTAHFNYLNQVTKLDIIKPTFPFMPGSIPYIRIYRLLCKQRKRSHVMQKRLCVRRKKNLENAKYV